ncbi:hypothetical protein ACFQMM_22040, partial [Saliphagus sp. GCM10025308]
MITFLITADDPDDDTVIFVDTGVEQHEPGETIAGGRTIRNGGQRTDRRSRQTRPRTRATLTTSSSPTS